MGKVYTPAQAAATAKYLSQFKQVLVRLDDEQRQRLDRAVEKSGKTQRDFVMDAIEKAIDEAGE